MKTIKRLLSFGAALLLSLSSLLVFAPAISHATVHNCAWTGATNNNFNTAGNWSSCNSTVPQNGDTLTFDTTSLGANATLTNDIASLSVSGITVSGTNSGSYGYTISSNALTLTGDIANSSSNFLVFSANLTLGAAVNITGSNGITVSGVLALGANNLTVDTYSSFYSASDVSGSGDITVGASKSLTFASGTTSFTGHIIDNGGFSFNTQAGLAHVSGITVADGAYLSANLYGVTGDVSFAVPITLNGDGITGQNPTAAFSVFYGTNTGKVSFTSVTLNADSTFNSFGTADQETDITATLNGHSISRLDGSEGILKVNGNSIDSNYQTTTINDTNANGYRTFFPANSPLEVTDKSRWDIKADISDVFFKIDKGGIVELEDAGKVGGVTIESGGLLKGSGNAGIVVDKSGGHVAPGHSPGCLSTGNLTLNGTLDEEIGGTTACTGYDQLKVTGTVDVTNGTLNATLYNGFKPVKGQKYTIIDNDGSDAVTGTFTGLAEGATVKVGTVTLQITYKGGDGNDVVLSVLSAPDTGFAQLTNSPILVAVTSLFGALTIAYIARKYAHQTHRR